jgi:hypothetical protein
MSADIDTSRVLEFKESREPAILTLGLLNLMILFAGLELDGGRGRPAYLAATAVFAAWASAWAWKFLKYRRDIVTITPSGLRDRRLMEEFIPWRAVRAVRLKVSQSFTVVPTGFMGGAYLSRAVSSVIELDVDPAYISRGGDWTLRRSLTLEIGVDGLRTDGPALRDIFKAYAAAAYRRH